MLKNEYLLAKIGVDTAENEPEVEVWSINYTCTSHVEPSVLVAFVVVARNTSSLGFRLFFAVLSNELKN